MSLEVIDECRSTGWLLPTTAFHVLRFKDSLEHYHAHLSESVRSTTWLCKCVLTPTMDPVPDLVDAAPNAISWTAYHGVEHLNGQLRPPYSDSRNLLPPFQIWDLLIHMFETARRRYGNRSVRYTLRMGFGVAGANRYNLSMRGQLNQDPDPDAFLGRIERMLDSNDTLDIRDIRLLMVFVQ